MLKTLVRLTIFEADLISILTKCLDTCLEMEFNTIAYRIIARNLFSSDDTLNSCFVDRIRSTKLKYVYLRFPFVFGLRYSSFLSDKQNNIIKT